MITLTLDLEIVGYEANRATCMCRLERRVAEATTASTTAAAATLVASASATVRTIALTATTAALIAAIAVVTLTVLMATASLVASATAALVASATTALVASATAALVASATTLASSHVLLILLPRLLAAVAWLEITTTLVATALPSILIVTGITVLLVIV